MPKDFTEVFEHLKAILEPYAEHMTVVDDSEANYYLDTRYIQSNKKPLYFASTIIKKNYVSFYLMPVYLEPGLLAEISEPLRKRMQGKSCFNFKAVDEALLAELTALTQAGFVYYESEGYIVPEE